MKRQFNIGEHAFLVKSFPRFFYGGKKMGEAGGVVRAAMQHGT